MHRFVADLLDFASDFLTGLEMEFNFLAGLLFEHRLRGVTGLEIKLAIGKSGGAGENGEKEDRQCFHSGMSLRKNDAPKI